jgi:hypothetical protein
MEFQKYQHIERFGTDEVEGIEIGECYVFPKIDGTNSQVWLEDGQVKAGSRNRELTLDNDNAGFYNTIINDERIKEYLNAYPEHRLYGEWLVPHSLKTYRDDAWRKFYVFDVYVGDIPMDYGTYKIGLDVFGIDYINPIRIIRNGGYEDFIKCLDENHFLIKDGQGTGEGIVIKNYSYKNKYSRQTWAKIVTSEFKEKHFKEMGAPITEAKPVELEITDKYVTPALVEKEFEKIKVEQNGWKSQFIPMLLGKVYYTLVNEEMWHIVKEFNNPRINFKTLNAMCIQKIKSVKAELF